MDRLRELEVFVGVADAGSLARAAQRLRLSPPAVTRAITALEERLGARVFHRTTRSLAITEVGRRYLESARRILADLEAAEKEAVGEATDPQGHLVVTASVAFGRSVLGPVVAAFLQQYPRVTSSVLLLDRVAQLVDEGIDVAVRIGELPDSSLVAQKVGSVRRILVASPAYLKRRGTPASPDELRGHAVIGFTGLMPTRELRFHGTNGDFAVTVRPALEINDAMAAIDAARSGHGITIALSYMVRDAIADGALVEVLDDMAPPPRPVHLVHPEQRMVAPKVRAFLDFAAPRLRKALADLATARG